MSRYLFPHVSRRKRGHIQEWKWILWFLLIAWWWMPVYWTAKILWFIIRRIAEVIDARP